MDFTAVRFDTVLPGDRGELAALYDRCFSVPEGASFMDDFPVWDPGIAVEERVQLVYRHEGRIVASASARLARTRPGNGTVAVVGAVVTDPELRGKGLASRALASLLPRVECARPQAVVLWGSEADLYAKFGFAYGGLQCRSRLGDLKFRSSTSDSKLEIRDGWGGEIESIMNARPDGLVHRDSDRAWIVRHPNVLFFRLFRDGKCTAFAGVGRGIDLTEMVHEWGGDERDLGLLLSVLARENADLQILYHPRHERSFYFLAPGGAKIEENLCMAKVLSPEFDLNEAWFYGLDSG